MSDNVKAAIAAREQAKRPKPAPRVRKSGAAASFQPPLRS